MCLKSTLPILSLLSDYLSKSEAIGKAGGNSGKSCPKAGFASKNLAFFRISTCSGRGLSTNDTVLTRTWILPFNNRIYLYIPRDRRGFLCLFCLWQLDAGSVNVSSRHSCYKRLGSAVCSSESGLPRTVGPNPSAPIIGARRFLCRAWF